MRYPRIAHKVFCEPWCIMPEQHLIIQEVLLEAEAIEQLSSRNIDVVSPFGPYAIGAGLTPPTESGSRMWTKGQLAVIPVRGIIGNHLSSLEMMCGGYGVEQLSADIERAQDRDHIKRVLLDFHSPGGTVTGVPEAAAQFAELGKIKDTYAITTGLSASASYWIMSQANHIYSTKSAQVGSIGVYTAFLDRSEARAKKGEKLHVFHAGKYKAMGLRELTDEDKTLIQASVDKVYGNFTRAITAKRPKVTSATMQGQVFDGEDAMAAHLVDGTISSFNSIVNRLS